MEQQVNILNIGRGREIRIPVNYQNFILNYSSIISEKNVNLWQISKFLKRD